MWIKRIEIAGWRSFSHEDPVIMEDCGAVNLLLGPNNVGKSNVQRFFRKLADGAEASSLRSGYSWINPHPIDFRVRDTEIAWNESGVRAEIEYVAASEDVPSEIAGLLADKRFVVGIEANTADSSGIVLPRYPFTRHRLMVEGDETPMGRYMWSSQDGTLFRLPNDAAHVSTFLSDTIYSAFVDSIRIVGAQRRRESVAHPKSEVQLDVEKVTGDLAWLSNHDSSLEWWRVEQDVQRWLARLLGCEAVRINFKRPDGQASLLTLQPQRDGAAPPAIPLGDFGSGVAECLVILAFLRRRAMDRPMVLFVDEIEAHLHPAATRELVAIIRHEFPNIQLFLATHSTDLLDAMDEDWRLFKFSMPHPNRTHVENVCAGAGALSIIRELGYRPSQLFLANAVVYVEGPSDAVYLRTLIRQRGESLLERRDYSFLFYGGSNLSHVSYLDDDESLIELLRSVHHPILVCDRDHESEDPTEPALKPAVQRMRADAVSRELPFLLTPGYEVESLVSEERLAAAVNGILASATKYRGTVHANKLDLGKSLRNALVAAIEPEDPSVASATDIATYLARKKKVEIAQAVTRDFDAATFSEGGAKLGDDLCRAIASACGRRSV